MFPCIKLGPFPHNASKRKLSSSCWFLRMIISINPFWIQLCYFAMLSAVGYLVLKMLEPKNTSLNPNGIDVFFMVVSAVTVSSMSTLEMEDFSNSQLLVLTLLMLLGGEVFVSMLGLLFRKFQCSLDGSNSNSESIDHSLECRIELGINLNESKPCDQEILRYNNAIKRLGYVVLCYLLLAHFVGFILTYIYSGHNPSTRSILKNKGLSRPTFALFTIVSTFANCGFLPTKENMAVFQKNTGLMVILIPQVLLGNTLYPVALRLVILTLARITKSGELRYMLRNYKDMGYLYLLSGLHSWYLAATVVVFLLIQFVLFCFVEWHNMDLMVGLNGYEKVVGSLFQVVNTRHSGEFVFDVTKVSASTMVVFVVMMYFPPLTTFFPIEYEERILQDDEMSHRRDHKKRFVDYLVLSHLSYLVIFTIVICLTESKKLDSDPINFNVWNIAFEVVSAYGNVGLSTGYSCAKRIKNDGDCQDAWYGFAGRWSNSGKVILILVMFIGRLKKFNKNGGRFWKLT